MRHDIDFNKARTNFTFFKTKLRGYLLGSDSNENAIDIYLNDLETWINALATLHKINIPELNETSYLHNELSDVAKRIINLRRSGKETEARDKFIEIETKGNEFLTSLTNLQKKIA